jgi:hypothetical protein
LQADTTGDFVRFAELARTSQTEIVVGSRVVLRATSGLSVASNLRVLRCKPRHDPACLR